jgi:hypothetical protein
MLEEECGILEAQPVIWLNGLTVYLMDPYEQIVIQ